MIHGELKTTRDGELVLEVDYYAARQMLADSLSLLVGVCIPTEQGVFLVTRVGRDFKYGRTARHVYLYVTSAETADDVTSVVAEKARAKSDARFEASKRPAPSLGADAPIGW